MMSNVMLRHLVLFPLWLGLVSQAAVAEEPLPAIEQAMHELLTTVRDQPQLVHQGGDRLPRLVDRIMGPHIDFPLMSRLALGKHWKRATAEQRHTFVREFRTLLVKAYSKMLIEYVASEGLPDHDLVTFLPLRMNPGDTRITLKSEIHQAQGALLPVSYRMLKRARGWKIYDVNIEGVSVVASYREPFAREISLNGIDGLIRMLSERNAAQLS